MKKLYFTLLSVGLFSLAHAYELPGDYYVGGMFGYGWTDQDLEGRGNVSSASINGNEWDLSAVAGMAWNGLRGSYIGIEGEIEFSKESTDRLRDSFSGDNWSIPAGAYGRVGWWFWNSTLFYGKLGVKETYVSFSDGGSDTIPSLEFAIGTEYIMNLDWTIRAEYSHERLSKSSDIFTDYDIQSTENTLSIGFMRHF